MILKTSIKKGFLFSVFILVSCSKPDIHINDKLIKELATINNDNKNSLSYIPESSANLLYVQLDNNKIVSVNVFELQDIYDNYYKKDYKTFYIFLKKILNQKIKLPIDRIKKNEVTVFAIEKQILDKPNDQIKKIYFTRGNDHIYYFYPKNLPLNTKQTILYKMFIDNYSIIFDDYGGKYNIKKIRDK
ncbi:hypothetical protein [Chryseobacterium sp.]|uniref:hypothetical protein n=1 Tax=Chryseobacterium sp. TaxID=1871047 RepID=UPI0033425CC6